jgi:basic amino acid/polyamine antiporter, APA family
MAGNQGPRGNLTRPPGGSGGLIPALGMFSTIMLVVGGVIGSGVFRKSGVMAGQLGSPELLLGVWLLAGVITMFGALTNAEIASFISETGGQYVYFERMYGPFAAFLYGWAALVVFQTGSIAALAYVFAEYATHFVHLPELAAATASWSFHLPFIGDIAPLKEFGVKCLAATVVVVLTIINYLGVRFGGLVQNIFTIAKLAGMAALLVCAFLPGSGGAAANLVHDGPMVPQTNWALALAIAAALQGAFWAYDGWVKVSYIAGEVREPQRIIPRATVVGMLIVTGVYLLLNVAYGWVLPIEEMAKSKLVAADVAERIHAGGAQWIAALVMISTFGANNAVVLASARIYFSMGRHGTMPTALGRVQPRFHTPSAALLLQGIWGVALIFTGTFDMLTDTLIFTIWIFYAAGAFGVFVLRWKEPNETRSYRVPGYPWVPAIFVGFAVMFLGMTVWNDIAGYRAAVAAGKPGLINCAFGTALVLMGAPLYLLLRRPGNRKTG